MQQSFLSWYLTSLSLPFAALMALAGLLGLIIAVWVVSRGRGPWALATILFFVHLPFWLGLFAGFQGAINAYSVMASSANPEPSELASGISTALIAPTVGLLLMAPAYAVAAVGALARSLTEPERTK